jgi:caa(3)-type oxidase subunit IV
MHSAIQHNPAEQHGVKLYVVIWAILLAMLFVSLALAKLPNVYLMNSLVFAVATFKAVIVMRYFMHLRFDPWLVTLIVLSATFTIVALLIGASGDVTFSPTTGIHAL